MEIIKFKTVKRNECFVVVRKCGNGLLVWVYKKINKLRVKRLYTNTTDTLGIVHFCHSLKRGNSLYTLQQERKNLYKLNGVIFN